jgi:hypothetical protein
MTPEERGNLAERLLPHAAHLICLVHGDGGPRDIQQALARLTAEEAAALPVILAALADPDRQLAEALAWVTWDEPARVTGSVRDLASVTEAMPSAQLRRAAIVEDTAELARQQLTRDEISERLGIRWKTVQQAHIRCGVRVPAVAS